MFGVLLELSVPLEAKRLLTKSVSGSTYNKLENPSLENKL
jgi:hypothetical protein